MRKLYLRKGFSPELLRWVPIMKPATLHSEFLRFEHASQDNLCYLEGISKLDEDS